LAGVKRQQPIDEPKLRAVRQSLQRVGQRIVHRFGSCFLIGSTSLKSLSSFGVKRSSSSFGFNRGLLNSLRRVELSANCSSVARREKSFVANTTLICGKRRRAVPDLGCR